MKLILWLTFVIALALYITTPIKDPDLWWHITVGQWILAHASIPNVDYWSIIGEGHAWRAYSWSNEIVFALTDKLAGAHGLIILKIIISIILGLSLCFVFGKISKNYFLGSFLGAFALLASFNHFTLRPQSIVWIFFVWLIYLAHLINLNGLKARYGLFLVLLMSCWSNTHLSSLIGIITVMLFVLPNVDSAKAEARKENLRLAVKCALLCILGTFLTPYLGGEWLTFISKTGHPFSYQRILEFQPANIMQFSTVFLYLGFTLFALMLHYCPKALAPIHIVYVALFSLGSLAVVKFLPFAVILICGFLARVFAEIQEKGLEAGKLSEAFRELERLVAKIPKEGLSFVFIVICLLTVRRLWLAPVSYEQVPVQALNFILENKLEGPFLNTFGQGGYLMYRLSDGAGNVTPKVAIDGRTNLIPANIWAEYSSAVLGMPGWQNFINRITPKTILWRADSPLVQILLNGGDWCVVFGKASASKGAVVLLPRDIAQSERFPKRECAL